MARRKKPIINENQSGVSQSTQIEALETRIMFDGAAIWLQNGIVHVQLSAEMNHLQVQMTLEPDGPRLGSGATVATVSFQPFGKGSIGRNEEFQLADIKSVVIDGAGPEAHSFVAIHEWDYTGYAFKFHLAGARKDYTVFRTPEGDTTAITEYRKLGLDGYGLLHDGDANDVIAAPDPTPAPQPINTNGSDAAGATDATLVTPPQFKITPFATEVLPDDRVDGHLWD